MRGSALTEIVLPRQMKKTAIIGIDPVKSAPVNEPNTCAVLGAKVLMSDPSARGTTIIPPGIFSSVRLILIAGSRLLRAVSSEMVFDPKFISACPFAQSFGWREGREGRNQCSSGLRPSPESVRGGRDFNSADQPRMPLPVPLPFLTAGVLHGSQ